MNIKTNKELNAFRGFTLIELLAVIVVLAIIILIAVQAVLPQMDKARRNAFAIEANTAIQAAQAYFTAGDIMGGDTLPNDTTTQKCVPINVLVSNGFYDVDVSKYSGSVQVEKIGNLFLYKVWIHNNEYQILGDGSDGNNNKDVSLNDVEDYNESDWSDAYNNCGNISDDTSDETP